MNTQFDTNMNLNYSESPLMRLQRMQENTKSETEETIYIKSSGEYYNTKYKRYHNDAQVRRMLSIVFNR
jgi:hypothetical protein